MYFIRHGESEFNIVFAQTGRDPGVVDAPLTQKGAGQAGAAGRHLKKAGIARILCSPYRRALQTASLIAETLKCPIAANPLLGERALYSCDVGRGHEILKAEFPHVDFAGLETGPWWPPLGETQSELEGRVAAFFALENDEGLNRSTLIVSHWYFLFTLSSLDCDNGQVLWRDEKGRFHKHMA